MANVPNPALIGDLAGALLEEESISREAKVSGKPAGPTTGLSILDEELGGFLSRGLHVLLAAPGAGKSALALQISADCGCPTLYITSEMPRVELLRRIVSRSTDTFLGKLRGGQLSNDELKSLIAKAALNCPMLALFDATEQGATISTIQEQSEALKQRFEASHVLIVIDSVTDWALSTPSSVRNGDVAMTEYAMAEAALNGLKKLTAHTSGAVLAIAHRNRAGHKAQGNDKLHTAKATGRYEYIAESVWDLDRDTSQEPDAKHETSCELHILKNRHGSTGVSIALQFEGRLQKFREG